MQEKLHLKKAFPNITQEVVGIERRKGNTESIPDPIGHFLTRLDAIAKKDKLGLFSDVINAQEKYILQPADVPQKYIDHQRQIARELGHGNLEQITDEQIREQVSEKQRGSLNGWLRYLSSHEALYPMWFKYFALRNVVRLDTHGDKRSAKSTDEFLTLDQEALSIMRDMLQTKESAGGQGRFSEEEKRIIESVSFSKLYTLAREKAQERRINTAAERKESSGEGIWVKYVDSNEAENLAQSVGGTGWCTAGNETARSQLNAGNFYVYYTKNKNGVPTVPRIAIRMKGDEIGEIRGVLPDQGLEPEMTTALGQKFKEDERFANNKSVDKYQKRVGDMKQLTLIDTKIKEKQLLTKEELRFLWEIDTPIEGFAQTEKDPRIEELRGLRDEERDFIDIFTDGREYQKIQFSPHTSAEVRVVARSPGEVTEQTRLYLGDLVITPEMSLDSLEYVRGEIELKGSGSFDDTVARWLIRRGQTWQLTNGEYQFHGLSKNTAELLLARDENQLYWLMSHSSSFDTEAQNFIIRDLLDQSDARHFEQVCRALSGEYSSPGNWNSPVGQRVKEIIFERQDLRFIEYLKGMNMRDAEKLTEMGHPELVYKYLRKFNAADHSGIVRLLISTGEQNSNLRDLLFAGGTSQARNLDFELAQILVEKGLANELDLKSFRAEDRSKIAVLVLESSPDIPFRLAQNLQYRNDTGDHFLDESVIDALVRKGNKGVELILKYNKAFNLNVNDIGDKLLQSGLARAVAENIVYLPTLGSNRSFLGKLIKDFEESTNESLPYQLVRHLARDANLAPLIVENISRVPRREIADAAKEIFYRGFKDHHRLGKESFKLIIKFAEKRVVDFYDLRDYPKEFRDELINSGIVKLVNSGVAEHQKIYILANPEDQELAEKLLASGDLTKLAERGYL